MENTTPARGGSGRRLAGLAALVAAGAVGGGILAGSLTASAASTASPATAASTANTAGPAWQAGTAPGGRPGGATPMRAGEKALTGTTAQRVRAAALKAVPGGTVYRVETDADGAAYEAHMTKPDGSLVTVKLDKSFAVTAVRSGMGAGGPGAGPADTAA